jgi:hypothetical protein
MSEFLLLLHQDLNRPRPGSPDQAMAMAMAMAMTGSTWTGPTACSQQRCSRSATQSSELPRQRSRA